MVDCTALEEARCLALWWLATQHTSPGSPLATAAGAEVDGFKIPDSYAEADINKARGTFKITDAAADQGPEGRKGACSCAAVVLACSAAGK